MVILHNIISGFETIQRDPIRNYAGQRVQIGKSACLRIRDTVEAHIDRNIIKTSAG